MINKSSGHKRKILLRLRELNKVGYIATKRFFQTLGPKYRSFQKTKEWYEAKKLLIEYFTYDNILKCSICGKVVDSRHCVLHHKKYDFAELFTPIYVSIIHPHCHKIIHKKTK